MVLDSFEGALDLGNSVVFIIIRLVRILFLVPQLNTVTVIACEF